VNQEQEQVKGRRGRPARVDVLFARPLRGTLDIAFISASFHMRSHSVGVALPPFFFSNIVIASAKSSFLRACKSSMLSLAVELAQVLIFEFKGWGTDDSLMIY
jgi:hypothetical protein